MQRESRAILYILRFIRGGGAAAVKALTVGITGTVGDEEAGEGKASAGKTKTRVRRASPSSIQPEKASGVLLSPDLPNSRSFRGPYLSMTMPMGRVMAESRKEPTVKARFSISSWALQMGQLFISRYSSESASEEFDMLRLEEFPETVSGDN